MTKINNKRSAKLALLLLFACRRLLCYQRFFYYFRIVNPPQQNNHIAKANGLDPMGEPIAYVGGELARSMQPIAARLMCPTCNH